MAKEIKPLEKKNWTSSFTLIGKACVADYTFKLDQHSDKSDWIYNMMNLRVDCGDKYGRVACELMGGYGAGRDNVIYVHGKDENGRDDFENSYTIDWEDRFDEDILKDIGELCFIKVGIEKDTKNNIVTNKFLTPYDAIAYVADNLQDGDEIKVMGQLKYTVYNDNVQVRKEVNRIYLKGEKEEYKSEFTQSMLLNKYSINKADKEKHVIPITGYILEKFKEYNGNDLTEGGTVRGGKFVPLTKTFDFEYTEENLEVRKKILDKFFKVKKNVTQITCDGFFIEGGAVVEPTDIDISPDIQEMIDAGMYTKEEAVALCAGNRGREIRMCITRPTIRAVGEEDQKTLQVQKFDDRFDEESLTPDYLIRKEDPDEDEASAEDEELNLDEVDDAAWLNQLDL